MKSGFGSFLPNECYIIEMDGRVEAGHRSFSDALKAALQLKKEFPQNDIKMHISTEVMRRPGFN
jgi:hypothetical protein